MKKVAIVVFIALIAAATVYTDELQDAINVANDARTAHRRNVSVQVIGWGLAALGSLIAADLIQNGDPAVAKPVIAGGIGAAVAGVVIGSVNFPKFRDSKARLEQADINVDIAIGNQAREEQAQRIARFTKKERQAILNHHVFVGMSEAAMRESLGTPVTVNRTVTGTVEYKQFVFGNDVYVYTENGVVTSWQD